MAGPEKRTVKHIIQLSSLFPGDKNLEKLQLLRGGFMYIIEAIINLSKIESCIKNVLSLYQAKDVTPYLYAIYFHVPEFFKLYKNIACFNQQGMEKYDITSKN